MLSSILGAATAWADTYRAGEFIVNFGLGKNGKIYHGCDVKGNCITLYLTTYPLMPLT
ncbi:MAG TPA: hypothetical protein V6D15_00160 [Oculatellaceae cyanobacterium]|jgi:hypothetical protein